MERNDKLHKPKAAAEPATAAAVTATATEAAQQTKNFECKTFLHKCVSCCLYVCAALLSPALAPDAACSPAPLPAKSKVIFITTTTPTS